MSFDKYLFEKYIKDCVVEILKPNQGTGFWVLPDGHILTCYHVLFNQKLKPWNRDVDIENIDIKIRYHEKEYTALFDKEHSKPEIDIAVLTVKQVKEKIHFVSLGDPELNTEVHVFGYRVDGNEKEAFKNGYHVFGMLRSGQVLNDGGLVYNLETHQPPNSSVSGMSGSPIYDINKKRVVGLQYSQEEVGPSICYVHPIEKVYKLWPELRINNFNSIRKDFNIYFLSSDLLKNIFVLSAALLQYQLENKLGKETIGIAEQTLVNIGDEKVVGKLYKILATRIGAKKLMDSILSTNKHFHGKCSNDDLCDAFTMPAYDLLSLQAALNDLPKAIDQENALKIIGENLGRDYPELTGTQIEAGLRQYLLCLENELQPLEHFILQILEQSNKPINQHSDKNENKLNDVLANLEKYVAQRGIYMALEDIQTGLGESSAERKDKGTHAQILILEEILKREALHLSGWLSNWRPDEQPAYFLQQVYNRINNDREIILRDAIENLLGERHQPWLAKYYPKRNELSELSPAFEGHKFAVLSLAFTPDGKQIVSASSDHTLRVWDIQSGSSLHTLQGHKSDVLCVAITPKDNKTKTISASSDKTIREWDTETGKFLTSSKENNFVWNIAVTSKNQHEILSYSDCLIRLRNLGTGQTHILAGHTKPCSSIAVTMDEKFFISASDDTTLRLWETDTGNLLRTFKGHSDKVFSVAIIPNSNHIISASADHTLRLWDISTGQSLRTFEGHLDWVHGVVVTPDGRHVISVSADNTLRLWNISTGECLLMLTGVTPFRCCAISPTGSLIAVGDQAGGIHFIEIRNYDSLK